VARRLDEPQGRGEFFTSLGRLLGGFVAGQVEEAVVGSGPKLLRPPGALPEFAFLAACTRCDRCLQACPQAAILKASGRARLAVNTPHLDPRAMACFLCTGLPCIPACPAGALVWPRRTVKGAVQEGPRAVKMGTAVVKRNLCLTWKAEAREAIPCRTCWARCPFPDEAIRMVEDPEGGPAHPEVEAEVCTGCGLCTFGCPTPDPAIVIEPERQEDPRSA
jgi:ferredoxin-type protein NapG